MIDNHFKKSHWAIKSSLEIFRWIIFEFDPWTWKIRFGNSDWIGATKHDKEVGCLIFNLKVLGSVLPWQFYAEISILCISGNYCCRITSPDFPNAEWHGINQIKEGVRAVSFICNPRIVLDDLNPSNREHLSITKAKISNAIPRHSLS